jgi:glycosyltransferase involved in cell wall biosynthesis
MLIFGDWKPASWLPTSSTKKLRGAMFLGDSMKISRLLWLDISTSLEWRGGVVGIIRAEIELTRHLCRLLPELRLVAFNGRAFVEVDAQSLPWVTDDSSSVQQYLTSRDEIRVRNGIMEPNQSPKYPRLAHLGRNLPSHRDSTAERLRLATLFAATAIPKRTSELLLRSMLAAYTPLRLLQKKREQAPKSRATKPSAQKPDTRVAKNSVPHPFDNRSTVLSFGWMDSGREAPLEAIRKQFPKMKCAQLIYDVVLIHEDISYRYPTYASERFMEYFNWVSRASDFLFCGGKNTQSDTRLYQERFGLPVTDSAALRFGDASLAEERQYDPIKEYFPGDRDLLRHLKISTPYLLYVGSIEPRKNHQLLQYVAQILTRERNETAPMIVFAGKADPSTRDLMDSVARDPLSRNRIMHVAPHDHALKVLYQHASYCLMPSLYEGWSLTLPEALSFGKYVLASDVAPLREIGKDMIEYLPPHEPRAWADRIFFYQDNPKVLASKSQLIKQRWTKYTWMMCAEDIVKTIRTAPSLRDA